MAVSRGYLDQLVIVFIFLAVRAILERYLRIEWPVNLLLVLLDGESPILVLSEGP